MWKWALQQAVADRFGFSTQMADKIVTHTGADIFAVTKWKS
jgi:hypothetical protein